MSETWRDKNGRSLSETVRILAKAIEEARLRREAAESGAPTDGHEEYADCESATPPIETHELNSAIDFMLFDALGYIPELKVEEHE